MAQACRFHRKKGCQLVTSFFGTNKKPGAIHQVSACRQSLQAFLYNKGNNTILWGMNMLSKREEERRNQLEVVA
ncbi:hypothetical protein BALS_16655, partial [Bacillus altitudinis]|uniref:hypothetical protein n=1 Tax=Bacillus altitudinis TaxID=293387 RepID=UPI001FAE04A6